MREKGISEIQIIEFISRVIQYGERVKIQYFHFRYYPDDMEDVAFLLCADNGQATHIVSYDKHLLDLDGLYPFRVCKPVPFLEDLRDALGKEGGKEE